MPATIKDVAIMANTSIATVSKVLNNKPIRVSDAKRKEILVAIEELNYIPNSVASGLKRGAKNTIAIAMPDLSDPFNSKIAKCIITILEEVNKKAIVYDYDENIDRQKKFILGLRDKSVDGLIIMSSSLTKQKERDVAAENIMKGINLPIVYLNDERQEITMSSISTDGFLCGYEAVKYLQSLGHKKIGFTAKSAADPDLNTIYKGYMTAVAEAGEEQFIAQNYHRYYGGEDAARQLLAQGTTAILAESDQLAIGIISYAFKNKIPIPRKLSVIGVDDIIAGRVFPVPLTTMRQDALDLARNAVKLLLDEVEANSNGKVYDHKRMTIKPKLIIRSSTGEYAER